MTQSSSADGDAEIERLVAIATEFRRRLEQSPGEVYPAHADTLLRLGGALSAQGQREGALSAVAEAVALYRAMDHADPEGYRTGLASALNNLSNCLAETARHDEAAAACDEAVALARQAASQRPDQGRYVLVSALINLAGRHMRGGDIDATLGALAEAVEVFRGGGAAGIPYLGPMIEALHSAALAFGEIGRWTEAVAARRLMVGLFPEAPPAAALHLLALTLHQSSQAALRDGDIGPAGEAADEATLLARALYSGDAAAYGLFLAQSLGHQAGCLHRLGQSALGLDAALEAVGLFQAAMAAEPTTVIPSLILTLDSLMAILTELDLPEQAASIREQRAQMQVMLELMLKGQEEATNEG